METPNYEKIEIVGKLRGCLKRVRGKERMRLSGIDP
jgi:hypothetical protein